MILRVGEQVTVQSIEQVQGSHGLRSARQVSPSEGVGSLKRIKSLLAMSIVVACGALSGCQSDVDGIAKNAKTNDIKAPSTEVEESFGETGAEITLLLSKGATGLYEGAARDVRDGAGLGVGELGGNQVFVKVVDVAAGAPAAAAAVTAAKARGSALLVSYASPAVTSAIAAVPADQRPPLLNLGAPVPPTSGNVYNFASDEIDSAVEGVRAAAAGGHKKVLVFAQSDFPAAGEERLANAIRGGGGTYLGIARYDLTDASASDAVKRATANLQNADTVLVLGKSVITTTIAGAVKASGKTNVTFVGTNAWPPQTYTDPSVAGAVIAMVEPEGATMIADRYKRHYKRTLSTDAAHGYDAVAIASGIVRTKGPEGLNAQNLTSKVGFRGVTGLFRLTPAGTVERKMSLYSLSGGKLNLLGATPASF
ncbi:ABC transporter substrate-binding protein [Rhizobium cauense]|uniref:ABC transporter substrate-binding protein n=1 Tax=Rhizobium cauense TaxID=1166683 RepID=UPI0030B8E638